MVGSTPGSAATAASRRCGGADVTHAALTIVTSERPGQAGLVILPHLGTTTASDCLGRVAHPATIPTLRLETR
jgi:hypothetical protein